MKAKQRLENIRRDIEALDALDKGRIPSCSRDQMEFLRRVLVAKYFRVRCEL